MATTTGGHKVRLKPEAALCGLYPELVDQVGTVSDSFDEQGARSLSVHLSKPAKILILHVREIFCLRARKGLE